MERWKSCAGSSSGNFTYTGLVNLHKNAVGMEPSGNDSVLDLMGWEIVSGLVSETILIIDFMVNIIFSTLKLAEF